jgi:hypothetical protein
MLLPWVRVIRHETDEILDWHRTRRGLFAIDIVHKDFFKDYLCKHVLTFAEVLSGLVTKHEKELASGKAFAVTHTMTWRSSSPALRGEAGRHCLKPIMRASNCTARSSPTIQTRLISAPMLASAYSVGMH